MAGLQPKFVATNFMSDGRFASLKIRRYFSIKIMKQMDETYFYLGCE